METKLIKGTSKKAENEGHNDRRNKSDKSAGLDSSFIIAYSQTLDIYE